MAEQRKPTQKFTYNQLKDENKDVFTTTKIDTMENGINNKCYFDCQVKQTALYRSLDAIFVIKQNTNPIMLSSNEF